MNFFFGLFLKERFNFVQNLQLTSKVKIEGEYETGGGSDLSIQFDGTVPDAQLVKDFLDPSLEPRRTRMSNSNFGWFSPKASIWPETDPRISRKSLPGSARARFT